MSDISSVVRGLPTPEEMYQERQRKHEGIAKPIPHQLAKVEKKKLKSEREKEFRAGVWERDKARSRASKKPVAKSGTDYDRVGEVHHVIPRSLAPERVYDIANGLLLTKAEHLLAETNCPGDPSKCLLDISGPDDRGELQTFIWRDRDGTELRRCVR